MSTFTHRHHTVKIEQDQNAENPREYNDNLGILITGRTKYSHLGDWYPPSEYTNSEIEALRNIHNHYGQLAVCRKLYVYDHSGQPYLSLDHRVGAHQAWDSSFFGWAVITKADIISEYGGTYVTQEKIRKANACLDEEMVQLNHWLAGNTWVVTITDPDGEEIMCEGGWIGDNMEQRVKDYMDQCIVY